MFEYMRFLRGQLNNRPSLRSVALVCVLTALLAACGGEEISPTDVDGRGAEDPAGTEAAADPEPEGAGTEGDELVVGVGRVELSSLDPQASTVEPDTIWLMPMFDSLLALSPDGSLAARLADSWNYSEDGSVLTLSLRDDVTFNDGETFDAAAVKMSLERGMEEGRTTAADLSSIESIDTPDAQTVELRLEAPNTSLVYSLAARAGMIISPASIAADNVTDSPVGVGAFTFEEFQPGGSDLLMSRSDRYWDRDNVAVESLRVRTYVDQATMLRALNAGEIQYATLLDASAVEELQGLEGLEFDTFGGPRLHYLYTDAGQPPLDDVRVRKAVSMALDREELVQVVTFGHGQPTMQFSREGTPGHFVEPDGFSQANPEGARALLESAGFGEGEITFRITGPSSPIDMRRLEIIEAQLAKAGMSVDYITGPHGETLEMFGAGDVHFLIQIWSGRPDPAIAYRTLFGRKWLLQPRTPEELDGGSEILALLDMADAEPDLAAREALLGELSELVSPAGQALGIPLYHEPVVAAWSTSVVGVKPNFMGYVELGRASFAE